VSPRNGELRRSEDLTALARNPLLLSLLISLRLKNATLPRDRFQACQEILQHLVTRHRMNRTEEAFIPGVVSEFSHEELSVILGLIAYTISCYYPEGYVSNEALKKVIRQCLENPKGNFTLEKSDARKQAVQIFELISRTLEILISRSETESAFFHRSFQEYLTGLHISRLPVPEQELIVAKNCMDSQWREIILALFYETNRSEEIAHLANIIKEKEVSPLEVDDQALLLAEIAFGPSRCPAKLAAELSEEIFQRIDLGCYMPYREKLLHLALDGLLSEGIADKVQKKILQWFPCREEWRAYIYEAMAPWTPTFDVVECLIKGICDTGVQNQRSAAKTLAKLAQGEKEIGNQLAGLLRSCAEASVRAAAMESLLLGWPNHPDIDFATWGARDSLSPELCLVGIKSKIRSLVHDPKDWQELFLLSSYDCGLDYQWKREIPTLLVEGWPRNEELKRACLELINRPGDSNPDRKIIYEALIAGYGGDPEVAEILARIIWKHGFRQISDHTEIWELFCENFSNNEEVIAAVNHFLSQERLADAEEFLAAKYGMLPNVKDALLSQLDRQFPQRSAQLLMERWGMSDKKVSKKFRSMAAASPKIASQIAHLMPQVINDDIQCKNRLLKLIRNPECYRTDLVIRGLSSLKNCISISEIVDAALELNLWENNLEVQSIREFLYSHCASEDRVKAMAERELNTPEGLYAEVAAAYGAEDKNIRMRIIDICGSLQSNLRFVIVKRLSQSSSENDFSLSVLGNYRLDVAGGVTTEASRGYHNLLGRAGDLAENAVQACIEEMGATGRHYDQRRQAAFIGLLSLDRLCDFFQKSGGRALAELQSWRVPSIITYRPNSALLLQLIKHWENLNDLLGQDFWSLFEIEDRFNLWEVLAPFADQNASLCTQILSEIENETRGSENSEQIRFIARHRPKSSLLVEWCFETLFGAKQTSSGMSWEALTAASVLGGHFKGDPNILKRIMSQEPMFSEPRIVCLCEGWPRSDELEAQWEKILECRQPLTNLVGWKLTCCKSQTQTVFDRMLELLSNYDSRFGYWLVWYMEPALRRIRTDNLLAEKFDKYLTDKPSPSAKATFPRLLSQARGLSAELSTWCTTEAERQLTSAFPEIGFDLCEGIFRPVAHSLLDVIHSE
jgi:hypothetical protein